VCVPGGGWWVAAWVNLGWGVICSKPTITIMTTTRHRSNEIVYNPQPRILYSNTALFFRYCRLLVGS